MTGPAASRVALVIGNSAYRNGPPLANPQTDAVALAGAFERLGFSDVTRRFDLDKNGQDQALRRFSALAKSSDMAVIYFAGHGMEIDGENYLLPVDAELSDAGSLGFEATRLSDVMRAVEGARKFRFVILDACRDNPFRNRIKPLESTRSIGGVGLAAVEPPGNTLVAYAARHGTTAKDGAGGQKNSPYATALLNRLETPNLDIRLVLGQVRDDVTAATGNQQQPFFYGTLGGAEIVLKRVDVGGDQITRKEHGLLLRALEEERDWERALRDDTAAAFKTFLSAYPAGRFADQARAKSEEKAGDAVAQDEQREWRDAQKSGLSVDFRNFLAKWPGGRLAAEAKAQLTQALDREESYEFKAIQQSIATLSPSAPCPDPVAIRAFIARHAGSDKANQARAMLARLEATHGERFDLTERRDDGKLYLERFPEGARAADIRAFLDGAGDDRAWIRVLKTRDRPFSTKKRRAALGGYLDDWPAGRHLTEAQSLLKKFKWRKLRALGAVAATIGIAMLVSSMNRGRTSDYSPSYTPSYTAPDTTYATPDPAPRDYTAPATNPYEPSLDPAPQN